MQMLGGNENKGTGSAPQQQKAPQSAPAQQQAAQPPQKAPMAEPDFNFDSDIPF